jgi:antitoxin MazE
MQVVRHIQKWGNSAGVRLPKQVLDQANLETGQLVLIDMRGSSIVLTPVRTSPTKLPALADLLEGVTPEQVGGEFDWGPELGQERLDG